MKRELNSTNGMIALIGLIVAVFVSLWVGVIMIGIAIVLHFTTDRRA